MTQIKDLSSVDYASTNDQIPVYRPDRGDTRKMTVGQIYAYVVAQQGAQGSTAWGDITGTLSAQTDLQTALDGKQPVGSYQPLATVLTNTTASFTTAQETKLAGIAPGAQTGTVTSITGTGTVSGLTLTGTVTTSGNLTLGGTLAVTPSNFASQTANTFLAAPNGAAGVPTFRAIVAADVPTLNQNTTGSAATLTTARDIAMTGDVAWTVSFNGSGNVTAAGTIANDVVTFAKMQNASDASVLVGRGAGSGAGDFQEITLGTNLSMSGTTLNATGGGGGPTLSTAEINLGAAKTGGKFTIAGSGMTVGKPVLIQQAVGPYTGKGTRADEAEMDQVSVSASVTAANTITAYWSSARRVKGNFKFNYQVSA